LGNTTIYLKPGEKRSLSFTVVPEQMSIIDDNGKRVIEPGEFLVSVGGKQPGFTGKRGCRDDWQCLGKKFLVSGAGN